MTRKKWLDMLARSTRYYDHHPTLTTEGQVDSQLAPPLVEKRYQKYEFKMSDRFDGVAWLSEEISRVFFSC